MQHKQAETPQHEQPDGRPDLSQAMTLEQWRDWDATHAGTATDPGYLGRTVMQEFTVTRAGDDEAQPVGRHAPSGAAAMAITHGHTGRSR